MVNESEYLNVLETLKILWSLLENHKIVREIVLLKGKKKEHSELIWYAKDYLLIKINNSLNNQLYQFWF